MGGRVGRFPNSGSSGFAARVIPVLPALSPLHFVDHDHVIEAVASPENAPLFDMI
jgi:hypothetical protein